MNTKKAIGIIARILALTILGLIITILASAITPRPDFLKVAQNPANGLTMVMLFLDRLTVALIMAFILENTVLRGFRLIALLFWVFFGITTFVMQIETIIFGSAFPTLTVPDVLLLAFTALVGIMMYIPVSVFIMGKWKTNGVNVRPLIHKEYFLRMTILAAIYPMLYFFFGLFVAWQSTAVREFYAATTITSAQPLLTLIQVARGFLWVLAGLPLLVLFDKRMDTIIASTLCYSLLPSISLILPNPLMPEPVRMAHFVEIFLSMAIFGTLVGWIMTWKTTRQKI